MFGDAQKQVFFYYYYYFFFFWGTFISRKQGVIFLHAFLTSRDSCVQIVLLFVYGENSDYITNILM